MKPQYASAILAKCIVIPVLEVVYWWIQMFTQYQRRDRQKQYFELVYYKIGNFVYGWRENPELFHVNKQAVYKVDTLCNDSVFK